MRAVTLAVMLALLWAGAAAAHDISARRPTARATAAPASPRAAHVRGELVVSPRGPVPVEAPSGPVWFNVELLNDVANDFIVTVTCGSCEKDAYYPPNPPFKIRVGGGVSVAIPVTARGNGGTSDQIRLTVRHEDDPTWTAEGVAWVTMYGSGTTPPYAASITPSQPSAIVTANSTTQQTFTVRNVGFAPTAYSLSAQCTWNGALLPPTSCSVSPQTTVPLAPSSWGGVTTAPVTVAMQVGGSGRGGITLIATAVADGQVAGRGGQGLSTATSGGSELVVRALQSPRTPAAGARDEMRFSVANAVAGTYQFSRACMGSITCDEPTPKSFYMPAGTYLEVSIPYTAGESGTGHVQFVVSGPRQTWADAQVLIRQPYVSVGAANPGTTIERSRCLTIAVAPEVAYECGDLRIVHPLPSVTARGALRKPALVYNSQHERPYPIVVADVALPPGDVEAQPVQVALAVAVPGRDSVRATPLVVQRTTWDGSSGTGSGAWRRVALGVDGSTIETGVYPYRVTVDYGNGQIERATGELVVVNRAGPAAGHLAHTAPFGAGWWLSGYEQLHAVEPVNATNLEEATRILWVGGDGSTRLYRYMATETSGGEPPKRVYAAEQYSRPDNLVVQRSSPPPVSDGHVYAHRLLPNGARVQFDSAGRQVTTVDRLGQQTWFAYEAVPGGGSARRLSYITLPPSGTHLYYIFHYAASSGRVDSIRASIAGVNRTTRLTYAHHRLWQVYDPDGEGIAFSGEPGASPMPWYKPRSGSLHYFYFDSGKKLRGLARYSEPNFGGQVIAHHFCAAETRVLPGSSHCGVGYGPQDPAAVSTVHDGPRTDLPAGQNDTTRFWLDRFGGVSRVRNATGHTSEVTYGDARFPGLATRVVDFAGFERHARYDARGRILADSAIDPMPGVTAAVTRYEWHPTWDFVTQITSPENVIASFGYDAATGNRLWQQSGPATAVAADRVQFAYYDASAPAAQVHLARAVRHPAVNGAAPTRDSLTYDGRGNLHRVLTVTSSASGVDSIVAESRSARDNLGRVVADSTLIDGTPAAGRWQWRTRTYDLMDRVVGDTSVGPGLHGQEGPDSVFVVTTYDPEGNTLRVARAQSPDPQAIDSLVSRWEYDQVGRAVVSIPDSVSADDATNPREIRTYDEAGNLKTVQTRRHAPAGQPGVNGVITMMYDALNRLETRTLPAVTYRRHPGSVRLSTGFFRLEPQYPWPHAPYVGTGADTVNFILAGEQHSFTYDAMGRIKTAKGPDAEVTRDYFKAGWLWYEELKVRKVEGAMDGTHLYRTEFGYDRAGRRKAVTYPAQLSPGGSPGSVTYSYHQMTGELETVTDLQGKVYRYEFTERKEPRALTYPEGLFVHQLTYGPTGAAETDVMENHTSAPLNDPGFADAKLRDAKFKRDARGKLLEMKNVAGFRETLTATYTGLGYARTTTLQSVAPTGQLISVSGDAITHDPLGNLLSNNVSEGTAIRGADQWSDAPQQLFQYHSGTGRLREQQREYRDTLNYNAAGDLERTLRIGSGEQAPGEDRVSVYAADGSLRVADYRVRGVRPPNAAAGFTPYRAVFEEYRYDALGRRVWVRARRLCTNQSIQGAATNGECNQGLVRRTIWDGDQELGEIQMPGDSTAQVEWMENDTGTLPALPSPTWTTSRPGTTGIAVPTVEPEHDPNQFFGRVAYVYGLGIDQPIAFTRLGYTDATGATAGQQRPAFTVMPFWNHRHQAESGALVTGERTKCLAPSSPNPRCIVLQWTDGWFPYARQFYVQRAWHGTLLTDKQDKAGTLYRRNRYYDPQSGRFTQQDPIGLAGGLNLYGYAEGDPVSYSDPFGLCPVCDIADVGFFIHSAGKALFNPTEENIQNAALDAVGLLPIVPSAGLVRRVADFADGGKAFEHYAKHVKGVILKKGNATARGVIDMPEFGSFDEYRAAARSFMGGGRGSGVLEGVRKNGDLLRFDPTTGYFGVRSKDGAIRTFFRPDNGANYFYDQFK